MGGFSKKTVRDIKLTGKRVLLRTDYNVPDPESDFRIKQSIPTIEYILKQKPRGLVIISHLGRPTNAFDRQFSLRPVAERLSRLLNRRLRFVHDCLGEDVRQAASMLQADGILMLENLRFQSDEAKNGMAFARALVNDTAAEIFVQDGFGVVHRRHASTSAITKLLPSVAGLLVESELNTITRVMHEPKRPLVAVVGGAKIADKIEVLDRLVELADCLAIGGAMANNFLKIAGHQIGKSLYDKNDLEAARDVLDEAEQKATRQPFSLLLPVDAVVSESMAGRAATRVVDLSSHALSDIEAYPKIPHHAAYTVGKEEGIYDIGPISAARIAGAVGMAQTAVWIGALGKVEVRGLAGAHAPFGHSSRLVAEAMIGGHGLSARPFSLAGGGDTTSYLESEGLIEDFNHVSTGGGATLELIAGHKLPGIEALEDK